MLARLGRTALLLTALTLMIAPFSAAHEPAKPAPDLTGVWLIDFEAMEKQPIAVEFLNSPTGQMTRFMAFHRAFVFSPDGACEFADRAAAECVVSSTPEGELKISIRPDPDSGDEPRDIDAALIDSDQLLLKSGDSRGLVLRRVSDLKAPADDPALAARWTELRGEWRLDADLYHKTDWYRSLPEQAQQAYEHGPGGAELIVIGDAEIRFEEIVRGEEPFTAPAAVRGRTSDGGLIVQLKFATVSPEERRMMIVMREDGPDLVWLHLGLESATPFRRVIR
jgi:hypothetical protein